MPRFDPCANADAMFYLCKCQFWEKIPVLLFEKFPFLVLARNMIMLQHLVIQFSLHHLSSGCLQEVEDKGKFQTFGSKSGCGRFREMVNHKRFQIQKFDLKTFGILENWFLMSGGCNQRFNCMKKLFPVIQMAKAKVSLQWYTLPFWRTVLYEALNISRILFLRLYLRSFCISWVQFLKSLMLLF